MKKTILLLSLIASSISMAAEPCSNQAFVAALKKYTDRFGETMAYVSFKKSLYEQNKVLYLYQITDTDRGSINSIVIELDKKTCKVLSSDLN